MFESQELTASSSNGKSADSESVNEGSSPSEASIQTREWLNEHKGNAFISLDVEGTKEGWHYIELVIADCNRQIALDFTYKSKEQHQEALYKLNTLRSQLTLLEGYLHDNPGKNKS